MLLSMLGEKPGARALAPLNVFVDLVVPEKFFITFNPEQIIFMFVSNWAFWENLDLERDSVCDEVLIADVVYE